MGKFCKWYLICFIADTSGNVCEAVGCEWVFRGQVPMLWCISKMSKLNTVSEGLFVRVKLLAMVGFQLQSRTGGITIWWYWGQYTIPASNPQRTGMPWNSIEHILADIPNAGNFILESEWAAMLCPVLIRCHFQDNHRYSLWCWTTARRHYSETDWPIPWCGYSGTLLKHCSVDIQGCYFAFAGHSKYKADIRLEAPRTVLCWTRWASLISTLWILESGTLDLDDA